MEFARFIPDGLGWQRDLPDPRDYTASHVAVSSILSRLPTRTGPLPSSVDLRRDDDGVYMLRPDDQGRLNSSPAFACLGMVEYFQRRTLGLTYEGSPSFLFRMARRLERSTGNAAVAIRTTLKALRRYGAPPLDLDPYDDRDATEIGDDACLFGFADELPGLLYFRLDGVSQTGGDGRLTGCGNLRRLKSFLAARFPVAFGFVVPRSMSDQPDIPFRPPFDSYRGGQVVVAVGYDDSRLPGNQGAILIRSSWGPDWGESGYGWLPYSFVLEYLAADFWTIVRHAWSSSRSLYLPVVERPSSKDDVIREN